MTPISRVNARLVTLDLLRAKAKSHPEIMSTRDVQGVTMGIKKAFATHEVRIDEDAAEGIAEAIQEFLPAAHDAEHDIPLRQDSCRRC